ncbi:uncharacterized protein F5147DRAFT_747453 [Suillus discolor]|uniref:Transposase n=1 Tax=Suillus discolor TaxID=1912936 RepID=A0A9P7JQA8_9AGAM|nr:uncharacterized protein F5147DRAFT_747453 [Suillus discolor]KAG2097504.1 hypothetical protein F5147DRAFT_747453 [Suillus discolor]
MKEWNSPVYAFFDPTPHIIEIADRHAHEFKCQARGCKVKGDARSTGNMRKHVRLCWGDEVLKAADSAKDADEVRLKIVGSILQNGSITASFECKGKGKIMYSHRQHTRAETRAEIVCWVSESLCPFNIVKDRAFQSLMKTGRPEYYIPSPSTVSHDVMLRVSVILSENNQVLKMYQEHKGKINFTTDGWTSPNHRALVAFLAHFEYKGELLSILLDVIEVGKAYIWPQQHLWMLNNCSVVAASS